MVKYKRRLTHLLNNNGNINVKVQKNKEHTWIYMIDLIYLISTLDILFLIILYMMKWCSSF